jgi:DNA (cytosine-5)-methyltransferase 1
MGYHRAGFDVVGVDLSPQPDYPFEFRQGDAMEILRHVGTKDFDAIHASPPCQAYSTGVSSRSSRWSHTRGKDEPALIKAVHSELVDIGVPWVIENVMGARPHMPKPWFVLCGAMFNRPIPRHRVFATSMPISLELAPEHPTCRGLAKRSAAELGWEYRDMSVTGKGRRAGTSERWSYLLDINWPVKQLGLAEAIPPAYTQHIGRQLLAHVESEEAA